jgi:hypothetical protein
LHETVLDIYNRSDSNTIPPLKADGILHPDSKDKANILNKQFQMAFSTKTEVSDESFKNTCNMKGKFETMHDIQITMEGVTKLLKNLNPHKAPGPENITPSLKRIGNTYISNTNNHIQGILQHRRNTQYLEKSFCLSHL